MSVSQFWYAEIFLGWLGQVQSSTAIHTHHGVMTKVQIIAHISHPTTFTIKIRINK